MKKSFPRSLLVVLLFLGFSACSRKQDAATTQPAPAVAPAPAPAVPAPVAVQVPAPAVASLAGDWAGDSGKDLAFTFTVEDDKVSNLNANYAGRSGSCSYNGGISSDEPAPIKDKAFIAHGKNDFNGLIEFTASGTFTSPTEASGTVIWKGKSKLCGDIALQYNWTAKRGTPAPADPDLE